MPAGWEAWSVDRTRNFKRLVNDVRRAKSLLQTQSAAGQLAAVYKVTPFELDPWGAS